MNMCSTLTKMEHPSTTMMDSPSYGPSWMSGENKMVEVTPVLTQRPTVGTNGVGQVFGNSKTMGFPILRNVVDTNKDSNAMHRDPSFASSSSSEDSVDAAILLTAMRSIASRELSDGSQGVSPEANVSDHKMTCSNMDQLSLPILSSGSSPVGVAIQGCDCSSNYQNVANSFQGRDVSQDVPVVRPLPQYGYSSNCRMRAVSFDENNRNPAQTQAMDPTVSCPFDNSSGCPPKRSETPEIKHPPVVHSYVTPTGKRKKIDGPATIVISPSHGKNSAPHKQPGGLKTILRRKFSWKNYPELEAFLVANREEYLRHSTLNYTVQQKQFNNRLTEQLIELAEQHGYVFDPTAFNFVTIRDRIRCYFKSYVQSSKKRGVIIGYAAKRAGLVTDRDLENSASTAGKIIVPT